MSVYKLVSISYIYTCMLIHIAKSCPTLYDLTDCSPPGSSAHGIFPRQEYWSGLPFPSPGDLPDPGIEPVSPDSPALAGKLFTTEPPGKPMIVYLDLYLYICIYTHKLNIQKTKIMASSPITSWEIDGETVETVADFIFLGSKITADSDCSHEIKRPLLLGRKVMTNLDSIFKSRDITLPTKVLLVKAMVFHVVMYGCESWTVKKAEH